LWYSCLQQQSKYRSKFKAQRNLGLQASRGRTCRPGNRLSWLSLSVDFLSLSK
jgi:hypothetical protein